MAEKRAKRKVSKYGIELNKQKTILLGKAQKLADKVIEQQLNGDGFNVTKAARELDMSSIAAKGIVKSKVFTDYLAQNGLDDSGLAKILSSKLKQHAKLPPGEDRDTPKYLDMALKTKGLYKNDTTVKIKQESDGVKLLKNLFSGVYETPQEGQEYVDTQGN